MATRETNFTPTQKELLEMLWVTQIEAKVGRRFENPDGSYRFDHIIRPTRPIDFALDGEFVLKLHERKPGDPLSPYYINLRNLPDDLLTLVAKSIAEVTARLRADVCTGIPSAGDPIAKRFSEITGIPWIHIFDKADSSSGRKIVPATQGEPISAFGEKHQRLLILDDLITEADTKFEAGAVAEELGYHVSGFGVLVDRQQGGKEQLEGSGYPLRAALPIAKVFNYYYTTQNTGRQRISRQSYLDSMNYLNTARKSVGLSQLKLLAI